VKKSQENLNKLYSFIKTFTQNNSYPPTVREMALFLDVKSTSTIAYYLDKLEKEGKLKKNPSKNRALEIIEKNKPAKLMTSYATNSHIYTTSIPMLGVVTAGEPIFAQENYDEVYDMPNTLFSGDDLFMLNIKGDSMINVGIHNGDIIVVAKQKTAKNGDVVVALIGEEATVKTYYKESNRFRLQPENDTMEPIYVTELEILGKVTGLIRKM
jgi:repressor LexA